MMGVLRQSLGWVVTGLMMTVAGAAAAAEPFLNMDGGVGSATPWSVFGDGEAVNLTTGNLLRQWREAIIPLRGDATLGFMRSYQAGSSETTIEEFTKLFPEATNHVIPQAVCLIDSVFQEGACGGTLAEGSLLRIEYTPTMIPIPGLGTIRATVDTAIPAHPRNRIAYDPQAAGWDVAWAPVRGIVVLTNESANRSKHYRQVLLVKPGGGLEALDATTGVSLQAGSGQVLVPSLLPQATTDDPATAVNEAKDPLPEQQELTLFDAAGTEYTFARQPLEGALHYTATYTHRCGPFWSRHDCFDTYADLQGWRVDAFLLTKVADRAGNVIAASVAAPAIGETQVVTVQFAPAGGGEPQAWQSIERRVFAEREDWIAPGIDGPRAWVHEVDTQRRFTKSTDPVGNLTTYRYDSAPAYDGYPRVRKIGLDHLNAPDAFFEVRDPTGGALRFEQFTPIETETALLRHVIVTEIPDFADPAHYFQKYYRIHQPGAPATKEVVDDAVQTTVNLVDGAEVNLWFQRFKGQQLLTKREITANGKHTTFHYQWQLSPHWERVDGLKQITIARDGQEYVAYTASYDLASRLEFIADAAGRKTRYRYLIDQGSARVVSDAEAWKDSAIPFDQRLQLLQQRSLVTQLERGVAGTPHVIQYDFAGTDVCGQSVPDRRVTKITKLVDGTARTLGEFCYDLHGNVSQRIEGPYHATTNAGIAYGYDAQHVFAVSETASAETNTLNIDAATGWLLAKTFANDPSTTADDTTTAMTYDAIGRPTQITSGPHTITHTYELHNQQPGAQNRITSVFHDGITDRTFTVTREYDGRGLLTTLNRNGATTTYTYHPTKRLAAVTYPGGRTAALHYDGQGRITTKTLSGWLPLHYSYGLESGATGPREVRQLHLGDDPKTIHTAHYDLVGQLVGESKHLIDQTLATAYTYDARGTLTHIDAPGPLEITNVPDYASETLTRTYPGGDQLAVTATNALGQLQSLAVSDPLGNLLATSLEYDAQHRLATIDRPATEGQERNDVALHYGTPGENAHGRLKEIVDHFGTTRFWYGTSGAVEAVERKLEELPEPLKVISEKDGFGNVTAMHYPHGLSIHYERDDQLRVTTIRKDSADGLVIATLSYDAAGNPEQIAYGNGITTNYTYDLAGRVARIVSGTETTPQLDEQYTYDPRGNKTKVVHLDGSKVEYVYDGANRLTEATYYKNEAKDPYETQEYQYDADGNRIQYHDALKTIDYEYSADKLTKATVRDKGDNGKIRITTEYEYALGNLVAQKEYRHGTLTLTKTFAYDAEHRLTKVTVLDDPNRFATSSEYTYDYAGRRERVTTDGRAQYFGYGESLDPLVEVNAAGEIETAHIFLGSRRVAAITGDTLKILQADELGNVLKVTDEGGTVTQTTRYDPFGNINFQNGTDPNPYGYAGKPYDQATGLIYFGARYYDPQLGRYLTRDPLAQGVNHYLYVDNNPLVRRDIFGLCMDGTCSSPFDPPTSDVGGTGPDGVVMPGPDLVAGGGIDGGGMNPLGGYFLGLLWNGLMAVTGAPLPQADLGSVDLMGGGAGVTATLPWYRRQRLDLYDRLHFEIYMSISLEDLQAPVRTRAPRQPQTADTGPSHIVIDGSEEQTLPPPTDVHNTEGEPLVSQVMQEWINESSLGHYLPPAENSYWGSLPVNNTQRPFDAPSHTLFAGSGGGVATAPNLPSTGLPNTQVPEAPQFSPPAEFATKPSQAGGLTEQPDKPNQQVQQQQAANTTKEGTNTAGDPVLLHSGELLQSEVDLRIPGVGIDYEFRRTYRSRIIAEGPLGFNWEHNYQQRLVLQANGHVAYFDGTARFDIYTRTANGSYTRPPGRFEVLTQAPDGTFQLRAPDGTTTSFDAQHQLASIADRHGNTLAFGYAEVVGARRLTTVTDTLGRKMHYSYHTEGPAAGLLHQVTDFTGRAITLAYNPQRDLIGVTAPATAEFPNGTTTTYTYSSGFPADRAALNHNLLTVTDGKEQTYLQNTYSVFDRVVQQRLGEEGHFTFAYHPLVPPKECITETELATVVARTAVRDRNGNDTVTDFNCQGQPVRIAEQTRSVRPSDPDAYVTTTTYNLDGLVTDITRPEGNRLELTYVPETNRVTSIRRVPDAARGGAPQVTTLTYDTGFQQPLSITNALGHTTTFTYDPQGNAIQIEHPRPMASDGTPQPIVEHFTYNANGQVTSATDAAGTVTQIDYAGGYPQHLVRDPDGLAVTTIFSYDPVGNLTAVTDPNGHTTQYAVNARNQITHVTDPLGHVTKLAYDANHNLAQIERQQVDETGAVIDNNPWLTTQLEYNALNRLTLRRDEITEENFALTEYRYDGNENLTRIIQPEGNSTHLAYDERDLPHQITRGYQSPAASTTAFAYDGNGNLTTITDGLGHIAQLQYDGLDRRSLRIDPLGQRTHWVYNAVDQLTQVQRRGPPLPIPDPAPLLAQLDLTRDAAGRIVQEAIADVVDGVIQGHRTTTVAYDARHQRLAQHDPLQRHTTWAYDPLGRVTRVTDPAGNQRQFGYDLAGQLLTDTVREVHATLGLQSRTTTYAYDAAGRLSTQTDPLGHTWHQQYDSLGRPRVLMDPLDTAGMDTSATTGPGNITRFRQDGLGRLIAQLAELRAGGAGDGALLESQSTSYAWDDNSRLTAVTDAKGNTTTYAYDALDRRTTTTMADGAKYVTGFNANSWVTDVALPNGDGLSHQYDALGQLRERHIARDGKYVGKETFAYDGLGRTRSGSVYDATNVLQHTAAFQYTAFDELLSETTQDHTVTNTFNAAGERTGLTYPGGLALTMTPDAIGRVTALGEATLGTLATWTYAGVGRPATMTYGSGAVGEWAYDGLARLAESTWQDAEAQLVVGHQLHYNKASQILADLSPQLPNATGQLYQYDSRWRLTQASRGVPDALTQLGAAEPPQFDTHLTYGLDAVDNVTTVGQQTTPKDPATEQHVSYVTNALHQYTTRTTTVGDVAPATEPFTYDASGNLIHDGQHHYAYTWRNQVLDVRTASGAVVVAYTYDAFGRRIARTEGASGAVTRYVYDGWNVIEEHTAEDALAAAYVYGDLGTFAGIPGTPLAMQRGGQTYFYHADHRGSIEALTDAQGTVVERYTYAPFGAVTITDAAGTALTQSAIGNPYFFTAKRRDPVTGLYDSRHRDYDPALGRFRQRDPLGYADGLNAYAYARSNPVNFVDPWGLSTSGGQGNPGAGNPPSWNVGTRALGGVRGIGCTLGAIACYTAAGFTAETGVGVVVFGLAGTKLVDSALAGFQTLLTGHPQDSVTSQALQAAGLSRSTANIADLALDTAAGVGAGRSLLGLGGSGGAGTVASEAANNTTALSPYRYTRPGETFQHYGYVEHAESLAGGLRPASYGTTAQGLSGTGAQQGLALRHTTAPSAVYTVSPPAGTLIRVNPITRPQFGQPGGLPEIEFILGTPPGSVSGPTLIPRGAP